MIQSVRFAVILVALALVRIASAAPGTLTVLTSELDSARVDAIRAEAAVRGLRVEVLQTAGTDALARALGERADVAAVIWSDGLTLWIRAPDGRVAHAPVFGSELSPRVVAAIASSLIDDLGFAPVPSVRVDVDVHVGGSPAPVDRGAVVAPGTVVAAPPPESRGPWYLDAGGLAAPGGVYEAHLGIGRSISGPIRGALIGHAVRVPGGGVVAATFEVSHTWGRRVRAELGGRAIAMIRIDDNVDCDSGTCMQVWSTYPAFGAGAFFGIGLQRTWGVVYARAGVDVAGMGNRDATPSGSLGVELPL
jgi:hypothetical protein